MKWLIEALNSPTDSIEYYLVNENLGVYKHHTIGEIKGFNLLRYRPSINKITGNTSFYKSCLKSWYDINPKYRVNPTYYRPFGATSDIGGGGHNVPPISYACSTSAIVMKL